MAEPAPTTNEPTIEADPELTTDDSDSTLGDDVLLSLYRFIDEQYRTLPHREQSQISCAELDRLDLTHQKLKILLDEKLLLCPVENPGRVLDVGTGTGIWAIEYGTVPLTMQNPESLLLCVLQGTSTRTPTYWGLILARLNHPGNKNSAALMKTIRD
ncbi:MAG: hypothetical protein Q9205_006342 [Flavoplaca limonia]